MSEARKTLHLEALGIFIGAMANMLKMVPVRHATADSTTLHRDEILQYLFPSIFH
jgi:hypothetical protein